VRPFPELPGCPPREIPGHLTFVGGVITTIWFTWGTTRDRLRLFRDLRATKQDVNDDGQVHEETPAKPT